VGYGINVIYSAMVHLRGQITRPDSQILTITIWAVDRKSGNLEYLIAPNDGRNMARDAGSECMRQDVTLFSEPTHKKKITTPY
jgi:hypothetical protein